MTTQIKGSLPAVFLSATVVLLFATPAGAQSVATSFQELRGLVTPGETIYVTDFGGLTLKGTLVDLSDSSVPLLRMSEREVNSIRIRRSDRWWNGPLIGFATGAIPGLLVELGGRSEYEKFSGVSALGLGSVGLLTGLLVDALNREKATIYVHRPEQPPASTSER
jgi:hypothetical protein